MNGRGEQDIEEILGKGASPWWKRLLKIVVLLVVMAILAAITLRAFHQKKAQAKVEYKTAEVTRGNLTMIVTATGNLQPLNQVQVGVEVSGTIATIAVDYNDRVKAGQVLAKLDTTKLEAEVLQAKAALKEARARIEKARATLKQAESKWRQMLRARELSGGRVPSQAEVDLQEAAVMSSKADLAIAQAAVDQAEATLRLRETNLAKAVIRAPIDGIVLARHVEVGQTVAASLQTPVLFTLAEDLRKMELVVDVDEADVGKVAPGQKASFSVDAYPDRKFEATVKEVRFSPKTVQGVVTYEAVLGVENPDLALRPGMTATAEIVVKKIRDALLVPNAALRFRPLGRQAKTMRPNLISMLLPKRPRHKGADWEKKGTKLKGKKRVWILRDGRPAPVPVVVGATDGRMTEIVSGRITPGMNVIVDMRVGRE